MHEHSYCQHELKVCEQCDTAYCVRCHKEWRNCHQPHYTGTTWYPWSITIPCTTTTLDPTTVSVCSHE